MASSKVTLTTGRCFPSWLQTLLLSGINRPSPRRNLGEPGGDAGAHDFGLAHLDVDRGRLFLAFIVDDAEAGLDGLTEGEDPWPRYARLEPRGSTRRPLEFACRRFDSFDWVGRFVVPMTLFECVRIAFKCRRSREAAEGRLGRVATRVRRKADRRRPAALAAWTLAAACGLPAVSPAAEQGADEANAVVASPKRGTSSTHPLRDGEAFLCEHNTGEQGIGHDPLVSVATSFRTPPRADPSESSDIRAVILVYHHVDTTTPASTSVTPERFAGHLDLLAADGYRVVPLADVVEALRFGKPLPDRAVVLTFDDAWRSVYTEAFPMLRRRGWPFTVFVSTDAVDGRHGNTMSWDQLREIEAGGGTIGNHSRTHDHLVRRRDGETHEQWRRRVGDDILWARRRLEAELVAPLDVFAYPYGEFTVELEALVRELGLAAVGQQSGPVGARTDPVRIPRFPVATGYDDRASLAQKLRTRALRVEVVAPRGRVLPAQGGPPALTLRVLSRGFALDALACFATGQGRAGVVRLDRQRREVRVRATAPLPAGRSKYTCTAPVAGRPGAYFWFSHPWLKARADGSWPGG